MFHILLKSNDRSGQKRIQQHPSAPKSKSFSFVRQSWKLVPARSWFLVIDQVYLATMILLQRIPWYGFLVGFQCSRIQCILLPCLTLNTNPQSITTQSSKMILCACLLEAGHIPLASAQYETWLHLPFVFNRLA
jgi:hypothetical protein